MNPRTSMLCLLTLIACGREAALEDWACPLGECAVCVEDSECVIIHNPCQPTAYCGHVDDDVAVTQEGCSAALEYETPPASACVCASTCGSVTPL